MGRPLFRRDPLVSQILPWKRPQRSDTFKFSSFQDCKEQNRSRLGLSAISGGFRSSVQAGNSAAVIVPGLNPLAVNDPRISFKVPTPRLNLQELFGKSGRCNSSRRNYLIACSASGNPKRLWNAKARNWRTENTRNAGTKIPGESLYC